jgi:hypothetical protein
LCRSAVFAELKISHYILSVYKIVFNEHYKFTMKNVFYLLDLLMNDVSFFCASLLAAAAPAAPLAPSLTTTSLMKKYVNKNIINGSKTNIQEITLNPLEHNQFKTHAQSTRNNVLVRSVSIP